MRLLPPKIQLRPAVFRPDLSLPDQGRQIPHYRRSYNIVLSVVCEKWICPDNAVQNESGLTILNIKRVQYLRLKIAVNVRISTSPWVNQSMKCDVDGTWLIKEAHPLMNMEVVVNKTKYILHNFFFVGITSTGMYFPKQPTYSGQSQGTYED